MIKKLKDVGMVVIDKSHKALYRTPISCMEYFNAIALTGFALIFFTNYAFIMGLPSYRNFTYMSPAVMWLMLVGLGISQFIATTKLSVKSTRYSGIILMVSAIVWAVIANTFNISHQYLTTAPYIYGLISTFCTISGLKLLNTDRCEEGIVKDGSK